MRRAALLLLLAASGCTPASNYRWNVARMERQEAWYRICPPAEWSERAWPWEPPHGAWCKTGDEYERDAAEAH